MDKKGEIEALKRAIIAGRNEEAVALASTLLESGTRPETIIVHGITAAMEHLDKKCTLHEFCLLELMLAGRAAMDVIDSLHAHGVIGADEPFETGLEIGKNIVLGTIKGDVHEIGKNIFSIVARSYGYQVTDLGKDVPPEEFVKSAAEQKADVIAVSSLITPTVEHVRQIRDICIDQGLDGILILAGGAALRQAKASYLKVDYVADTAFDGIRYLREAWERKSGETSNY